MELIDCSDLSPYKRYQQAIQLLRSTSRAENPNWYADALAVETQLHVFIGGDTGAISYIHNQKDGSWTKGPNLTPQLMGDPELLGEVLEALIKAEVTSRKKALGLILYIADEFSTAELGPDHQNPAEVNELRELIIKSPGTVLNDRTLSNDTHTWRLFPYPGASGGNQFATAISFSRHHEEFINNARAYGEEHDIPIRTRSISAPLCTITALPWLLEQTPANGFVAALHYPRFTVLSFFNDAGDLTLIRTLQHHGNMSFPPNIGGAIATTATSLELKDPHVFILPMAGRPPEGMTEKLTAAMPNSQVITLSPTSSPLHIPTSPNSAPKNDLPGVTRAWKWSDLHATPAEEAEPEQASDTPASAIPGVTRPWKIQDMEAISMLQQVRLEVVAITNPPSASQSPLASSHTFSILIGEMWPIQDFLPCPKEQKALYPGPIEMRALKFGQYLKYAGIVAVSGMVCYTAWKYFAIRKDESWNYQPELAAQELQTLKTKQDTYSLYDEAMKQRSSAWTTMESIFYLFPPEANIRLTTFKYNINKAPRLDPKKTGFIKRTNIQGLANHESLDYLNRLNTDSGRAQVYSQIAESTEDSSFMILDGERDPQINLQINEHTAYDQEALSGAVTSYPFTFTLQIDQVYSSDDELSFTQRPKN